MTFFALGFSLRGQESSFHQQNIEDKNLVYSALEHPTSILLRGAKSGSDYLKTQSTIIENALATKEGPIVLFGRTLNEKEIASLSHQKDLFSAYLENPNLKAALDSLGFDSEAYLRGSYDSDLGKLESYQELFTTKSAKSDLLFLFLQGKGPYKAVEQLKVSLSEMKESTKPFLNPNLTPDELREVFLRYPILKGFLHELPGMIDAVMAFELGIISAKEFREQLHVNLFHCGPSAGYWGRFQKVFLPGSFKKKDEGNVLAEIFKGTLYEKEGQDHLHYGSPSSFESFLSTLFDRLSQATKGGYQKIDWEIEGNPITNAHNLLLKTNIPWTLEQLQELATQVESAILLSQEQKDLLQKLITKSQNYLEEYQNFIKTSLVYEENEEKQTLTILAKEGQKKSVFSYDKLSDAYFVEGRIIPQKLMRHHLHNKLAPHFMGIEDKLGDPFRGFKWP